MFKQIYLALITAFCVTGVHAGLIDGPNVYQFGGGDPVNHTDPMGTTIEFADGRKIQNGDVPLEIYELRNRISLSHAAMINVLAEQMSNSKQTFKFKNQADFIKSVSDLRRMSTHYRSRLGIETIDFVEMVVSRKESFRCENFGFRYNMAVLKDQKRSRDYGVYQSPGIESSEIVRNLSAMGGCSTDTAVCSTKLLGSVAAGTLTSAAIATGGVVGCGTRMVIAASSANQVGNGALDIYANGLDINNASDVILGSIGIYGSFSGLRGFTEVREGLRTTTVFLKGRRGSAKVRDHLDRVRDEFIDANPSYRHVAGGRDRVTGQPIPEEYIPGPGGGKKGSAYPDLTFEGQDGSRIRINTVDTDAIGDLTLREQQNFNKIFVLTEEPIIAIPKPR